jgi:hypothetical protein
MDIWVICCGVKPQQSLQDIIELRARNWLPRKDITSCENLKVADDKTEDQIDEFCTRFFRVRDLRESQAFQNSTLLVNPTLLTNWYRERLVQIPLFGSNVVLRW